MLVLTSKSQEAVVVTQGAGPPPQDRAGQGARIILGG
jgi:hypothetical protein